jgi:predicted DNA-binding protein
MTPLLIRLAPELLTRLRALADEKGVSVACIIRSILEDWFRKAEDAKVKS